MKKIFIAILFLFPVLSSAQVVTPTKYDPDDFRYGWDAPVFTNLYGGTVFLPEETKSYDGFSFYACNELGNTHYEYVDILHLTNGSSSDLYGDAETVTNIPVTISPCPPDGSATSTFPEVVSGPSATPFELVAGEYYAFRINGGLDFINYYDSNEWIWGTTEAPNPPARAIEFCSLSANFLCGNTYFNVAESRTVFPSFDLDAHEVAPETPPCITDTLPYFDPIQCIVNAFSFLFVPDDVVLDEISSITLASSTPFSYLYQLKTYAQTIASGTPTSTVLVVPFMGTDIEVFDTTKIDQYVESSSTIRTWLTWIIWFVVLFVTYAEVQSVLHKRQENDN
jgi:hypothetical protein